MVAIIVHHSVFVGFTLKTEQLHWTYFINIMLPTWYHTLPGTSCHQMTWTQALLCHSLQHKDLLPVDNTGQAIVNIVDHRSTIQ